MLISRRTTRERGELASEGAVNAAAHVPLGTLLCFLSKKTEFELPSAFGLLSWELEEISNRFEMYPAQQARSPFSRLSH